jgi:hypothetical protein
MCTIQGNNTVLYRASPLRVNISTPMAEGRLMIEKELMGGSRDSVHTYS